VTEPEKALKHFVIDDENNGLRHDGARLCAWGAPSDRMRRRLGTDSNQLP
jgi:hypothetical protein